VGFGQPFRPQTIPRTWQKREGLEGLVRQINTKTCNGFTSSILSNIQTLGNSQVSSNNLPSWKPEGGLGFASQIRGLAHRTKDPPTHRAGHLPSPPHSRQGCASSQICGLRQIGTSLKHIQPLMLVFSISSTSYCAGLAILECHACRSNTPSYP
jgi:hypothetical protein